MKTLVARALARDVRDGELLGLGSGTTVELAIDQIGQRVARERLRIGGVPTSYRTALNAARAGIQVLDPFACPKLSWAFDGADEIDSEGNMIKGRGAAMLLEKIIARQAARIVIIASEEKLVDKLGQTFPIPVEIVPEAYLHVEEQLKSAGAREIILRAAANKYGPVITEHNNLVIDVWFDNVNPGLEGRIKEMSGVVESGLFTGLRPEFLIARKDGVWRRCFTAGRYQEELVATPGEAV